VLDVLELPPVEAEMAGSPVNRDEVVELAREIGARPDREHVMQREPAAALAAEAAGVLVSLEDGRPQLGQLPAEPSP
jgi:hypothetical protein